MATIRWLAKAQDIAQVDTVVFDGTWAASDTASLICNGKTLTLTGGASMDTTAEYAAGFAEMVNAQDEDNLTADMTINSGGQRYGEFSDMVATVSGSTVYLTSRTPGVPFTVTVAKVSTSGTITLTSDGTGESVVATGRNWWDNVDNWSGGSVPANIDTSSGDTALFTNAVNTDVLYGLENTENNVQLLFEDGNTSQLGLPRINETHQGKFYTEYRHRFFDAPLTATTGGSTHYLRGTGRKWIDFGTNDPGSINVYVMGTGTAASGHAVEIVGGAADLSVFVYQGSVGIGTNVGENATVLSKLKTSVEGTASIRVGSAASFANAIDTIEIAGGNVELATNCNGASNEIIVHKGKLTVEQTAAIDLLRIYGGTVDYRGTAIDAIVIHNGGTLDMTNCLATDSNNTMHVFQGFTFIDPHDRIVHRPSSSRLNLSE